MNVDKLPADLKKEFEKLYEPLRWTYGMQVALRTALQRLIEQRHEQLAEDLRIFGDAEDIDTLLTGTKSLKKRLQLLCELELLRACLVPT